MIIKPVFLKINNYYKTFIYYKCKFNLFLLVFNLRNIQKG